MSKWREVRLGDVVDINKVNIDRSFKGEILYVDISSVESGILKNYKKYDFFEAPSRARRVVKEKDIIYSTVRPNLKAYYQFGKNIPQNVIASTGFAVISEKAGASIDYIYYYMITQSFVDYLSQIAKGAAYPAVGIEDFNNTKIQIPDLETQKKVADVLSTYDELIENNNRRIEILERIAEEIYKEWFVRMRFPSHENTKFEKGIPIGWEVKKVGDIIDKLESGRRPKNSLPEDKMIVSLGAGDIKGVGEYSNNNEYLIPYSFFKELSRGKVENKDIAVYKDGAYTGKVTMFRDDFPYKELAINEHVFLVRCKDQKMQNYLLFTLKQNSYYELIQILSMTSAQPGINQSKFRNIKIEIPSDELIERFDCLTETCLKEIFNLAKQNQNLIKQRDLLLPRLMNGTIEVK